jgi:hypothetical protein
MSLTRVKENIRKAEKADLFTQKDAA